MCYTVSYTLQVFRDTSPGYLFMLVDYCLEALRLERQTLNVFVSKASQGYLAVSCLSSCSDQRGADV